MASYFVVANYFKSFTEVLGNAQQLMRVLETSKLRPVLMQILFVQSQDKDI